jgi:hypothetical protein
MPLQAGENTYNPKVMKDALQLFVCKASLFEVWVPEAGGKVIAR